MQNWKIKRMSNERINEWLVGINFLLRHYMKHEKFAWCPFCCEVSCSDCLWEIIEGMDCIEFKRELGITEDITIVRYWKKWHTARIPMLRRWKKILKAELARRDK